MNKYVKYILVIQMFIICVLLALIGIQVDVCNYNSNIQITGGSEFERNEVRCMLEIVDDSVKKRISSIHITDEYVDNTNTSVAGNVTYNRVLEQPFQAHITISNNTIYSIYYLTMHEIGHVYCDKNEGDRSEECADWYVTKLVFYNKSFENVWEMDE